jgi:hypothetical protein
MAEQPTEPEHPLLQIEQLPRSEAATGIDHAFQTKAKHAIWPFTYTSELAPKRT